MLVNHNKGYYKLSIENNPYALHLSINTLIKLINEWQTIRELTPDRIIFTYKDKKISISSDNDETQEHTQTLLPIIYPNGIHQFEWQFDEEDPQEYYKITHFPDPPEWSSEKVQQKTIEAFDYCAHHEIEQHITNNNKYYRLEGYTKDGIKIRMIITLKGEIIGSLPVIETTYKNLSKKHPASYFQI